MSEHKKHKGGYKKSGKNASAQKYGAPKRSAQPQDKKKSKGSGAGARGQRVEGTIDASGKGFGFLIRDRKSVV